MVFEQRDSFAAWCMWTKHLINESVVFAKWRHLNCMKRGHKRPLTGKGKKFGIGAADRGVWQSSGRG